MSPTPTPENYVTVWKFVSENALVSGILAALVIALLGWLLKVARDGRDSKAIYDFLVRSASESGHTFRSTHAISAATKISETRVAELCSRHRKIARNEKEAQTWRLA
jgi:hypothetical protein